MKTIARRVKQASYAALTLSAMGASHSAFAVGTASNTSITNRATVSYAVGGVTQASIESSPTGNANPGAGNGANTVFVVDDRVDFTVAELSGNATTVNPGQTNAVTAFTVTNTGNAAHAFQLSAINTAVAPPYGGGTDNTDVTNLRVFVDANNNGTYEAATDTAVNIATLAADAAVRVFIVSDVPATVTNGQFANVRLVARGAVNNTPATLLTQSAGADNAATVDIVFGDGSTDGSAARDNTAQDEDQYAVQSAALTVTKTSTVISDPFNGTTNPKAVPGAIVEYAIAVQNAGTVSATTVGVTDPIPTNTTFVNGAYGGANQDIQITVGATTTTCSSSAVDADGCSVTAGVLTVAGAARPTIAAAATGTVRFRVTIN